MRTVVCFRDVKNAALYFDRILPVAFRSLRGTGTDIITEFPEPIPSRALVNVVFDRSPRSDDGNLLALARLINSWDSFTKQIRPYRSSRVKSSTEDYYEDLYDAYLANSSAPDGTPIRTHFQNYAGKLAMGPLSVLLPSVQKSTGEISEEDSVATLAGLSLIDVKNASWDWRPLSTSVIAASSGGRRRRIGPAYESRAPPSRSGAKGGLSGRRRRARLRPAPAERNPLSSHGSTRPNVLPNLGTRL